MLLLGIDAGGTSTRATVLTEDGTCVGYGTASGGNPISSGAERASSAVLRAFSLAADRAGVALSEVASAVMAMAGSGTATSARWLAEPLSEAGYDGSIAFRGDLLAAYFSGAFSPDGYALVAGTGAATIRVKNGEIEQTGDGLGWLIGDGGSGFWIGHRVVLAVAAELDGRGGPTALTPLLLDELGLRIDGTTRQGRPTALAQIIEAVYALRPVELARFAPLAFRAGEDVAARRILEDAADELSRTFESVRVPGHAGPVVLGGSVLAQPGVLSERVRALLAGSGVDEVHSVADGAVGAAVIALRSAGIEVDADVFERVRSSLAALRA